MYTSRGTNLWEHDGCTEKKSYAVDMCKGPLESSCSTLHVAMYSLKCEGSMSYEEPVTWEANMHRELSKGVVLERNRVQKLSLKRPVASINMHASS